MQIETLERALSVRQPYVEWILTGEKTAEHRTRPTNFRGRVYLYASKTFADVEDPSDDELLLPRGLIVGSVNIADCNYVAVQALYHWKLTGPVRYDTPVRPQGTPQPSFWRPKLLGAGDA